MAYDVAALPFQAHANYGAWSIDFAGDSFIFASAIYVGSWLLNFVFVSYTVIALPNITTAKVVALYL